MSVTKQSKFTNKHAEVLYTSISNLVIKNYIDFREKISEYFENFEEQIAPESSAKDFQRIYECNKNIIDWIDAELLEHHYNLIKIVHAILTRIEVNVEIAKCA